MRWSPVRIDGDRAFVFAPRSGRTYLVGADTAAGAVLPRLLGLRAQWREDDLPDPADGVLPAAGELTVPIGRVPAWLYRFIHHHRRIAAPRRALALVIAMALLRRPRVATVSDIAAAIRAIERRAGLSDCYPRALLTAYLCVRAGMRCAIAVGILAPTPKLHAWCVVEGLVPFEPEARHWWYQPLLVYEVG